MLITLLSILASTASATVLASGQISQMNPSGLSKRQQQCAKVTLGPAFCQRSCGPQYVACNFFNICYDPSKEQCCDAGSFSQACPTGFYCTDRGCCPNGRTLAECGASTQLEFSSAPAPEDSEISTPDDSEIIASTLTTDIETFSREITTFRISTTTTTFAFETTASISIIQSETETKTKTSIIIETPITLLRTSTAVTQTAIPHSSANTTPGLATSPTADSTIVAYTPNAGQKQGENIVEFMLAGLALALLL